MVVTRRRRYRGAVAVVGGAEVLLHPALGADLDGVVGVAVVVGDGTALGGPVAGDGVVDEATVFTGYGRAIVTPALGDHAVEQGAIVADVGAAALRGKLIFINGITPHYYTILGGTTVNEQSAARGGGEAVAHHAAVQGAVHRGDAVVASAGDNGAPGGVLPVAVNSGSAPLRGVRTRRGGLVSSYHRDTCRDSEFSCRAVVSRLHEDGAARARRRNTRRDGLLGRLP